MTPIVLQTSVDTVRRSRCRAPRHLPHCLRSGHGTRAVLDRQLLQFAGGHGRCEILVMKAHRERPLCRQVDQGIKEGEPARVRFFFQDERWVVRVIGVADGHMRVVVGVVVV